MSAARWVESQVRPYADMIAIVEATDRASFERAVDVAYQRILRWFEGARADWRRVHERVLSRTIAGKFDESVPALPEYELNGPVDVVVFHPDHPDWIHLAECKKWGGLQTQLDAMQQLRRRGTPDVKRGLVVMFFVDRATPAAAFWEDVKRDLFTDGDVQRPLGPLGAVPWLADAFQSEHVGGFGGNFAIVHLPCDLVGA